MKRIITGFHTIDEILRAEKLKIEKEKNTESSLEIFYSKEGPRVKKILETAHKLNIKIEKKEAGFLDSLTKALPEQLRNHRGIVLIAEAENQKKGMSIDELFAKLAEKDSAFVVMLDSVTDPHNTGSIIRSADQFGIDGIIVPENKSAGGFEIIGKVSAGASAWVPYVEATNLVRTAERLKKEGFWIYGADAGGKSLPDIDFPKKTALIMGSEGKGMSRLVEATCDEIVSIPTHGKLDSLNVSVAAGILLYEISRKKEK
ncbi:MULTISPECIES: 23S rRNA (guanosine(2251)-2'-O)-methyltransferase RlmB [unclassified Treponema]|uniref:23S rRNA (guanosine(2251)-2'-O)-methyltransferase RlmB n=1 Tax=unclassified Treponema TaxID=2638727 RepID=UPI0020A578D0|nr:MULTISPECIES: 23S rRNA (guanosine(2251)-2'-O)-methyltransferase RlmB [unclassified Treponema]UTC68185.1 23S rRNA (guanosine(2251)-2'-O)-methyltransferase RlmB [Treponema sp. OMZ 789]UTC70905.1 23S rRNA (guanosine(2251)-2'-O)-methyltransferase RlmB [Treponema sp. OMZ 790]UTC73645.1 23S rRNA (guanosine(2251)-2'-O)-methyltransferase RlmB [Treponema sp. OMZ 791]